MTDSAGYQRQEINTEHTTHSAATADPAGVLL
jgi:hypothetical protein